MSEEKAVTITVDHDLIVRECVDQIVRGGRYDYDDWETESASGFRERMQQLIESRVNERVDDLVNELALERVRELVGERIEAAVAEGFPVYDRDGRRTGVEPFAAYVRQQIDRMFEKRSDFGRHSNVSVTLAEKAFAAHVQEAFKAEAESVRAKVREWVDEQLAGAVIKSLREAVGLPR